jgi:cyclase
MTRAYVLVGIVTAGAVVMAAAQQPPAAAPARGRGRGGAPAPINLQLERVRPNIYQLPIFNQSVAPGATTTIFVTQNNGVVVVDTKNPGSGQAIIDFVKKITDKPITTIINTHTHTDHTGGNQAFDGKIEVVTQENTAGYMAKMDEFVKDKKGLPTKTFKTKMTLFEGTPDAIDLYFFGPAHTGGDAFVVFRTARVMAAGDVDPATGTPIIDPANGGSGLQWGQTIAKAVAGIKNVDVITRGHTSQTDNMGGLAEYGQYMTAYANAVRTEKKAGKSVEDAIAEVPGMMGPKFKDYFLGLSGRNPGTKANVTMMYTELDKETAK